MGKNRSHTARFFPAKRLSIFLAQNQTPFKRADFFSQGQFSRQKTYFFPTFFTTPFKSASFSSQKNFSRQET